MLEQELIEKAKGKNQWAMNQLLKDNYQIIYGYILKISMNEETAKDITQEVMVRAIMHISNFKGNSKFTTWLISIASNIYKDSFKKNRSIPSDFESLNLVASENTEQAALLSENINRLKKSLKELPEGQRKVFILKHFYNYSYEEIAKILDCPVGTVRSKLHYSILKLRNMMNGG